jgi:UDP-2,3-diacylglucosamine hydrolase
MPEAGAPPSAPEAEELVAPDDWRSIDFISDLHLSAAMPRTAQAAYGYLRSTDADAVFILGDLFEVWVGDDAAERPFEHACVSALADAARRRMVAFMPGNRDFLLGSDALRACGMRGLGDPALLMAFGRHVLLSHGDALCLADTSYQAFRREVRGAAWQSSFLARPLEVRLQMAADMRRASTARRHFDGASDTDIDVPTALHWLHARQATTLVHGHTHRPGSETLAPGLTRHVLSDWDLDHAQRAEVLRLTAAGFERVALAAG